MSSQHTPGPLFVGARENAIVRGYTEGIVVYRGQPAFTREDARLYAAAPDLLAAALELEGWWLRENIGKTLGGAPAGMFLLRAAIEKATGGAS